MNNSSDSNNHKCQKVLYECLVFKKRKKKRVALRPKTLYLHMCVYNVFGHNTTQEKKKEELRCDQRC